jgi:hypothetical protein
MQSCTCAMRAVTHWTLDFLPGLLYNLIFMGAAVFYASARRSTISPGSRGHLKGAGAAGISANRRLKDALRRPLGGWHMALLPQRLGDDKNQHRAAQSPAQQKIEQRIPNCREHGRY